MANPVKALNTSRGRRYVEVLPSGQYKFIKKSVYDSRKGRSSTTRKTGASKKRTGSKSSGGKKTMGKRPTTIPLPLVAGMAAGLAAPAVQAINGDVQGAMLTLSRNYIGWDGQKVTLAGLKQGLVPLLIGFLIHKAAVMAGVNRALGRSGIPLIRL